jgi:acyl-CoA thioesterase-2
MPTELASLVTLLALEKIEENLFRGQSRDLGWGTVFGGQVLGQALSAAMQTVPSERVVHSLHAYFLRPGDVSKPILFEVDRIRDGGSFNTRRVVAIQSGAAIFNMAASFHKTEDGFEHQDPMPDVPPPDQVPTDQERLLRAADRVPPALIDRYTAQGAFEIRSVDALDDLFHPSPLPPKRAVWLKTTAPLTGDAALHASLLAYVSDYAFLGTALFPHGVTFFSGEVQVASLDHVMWFHAPFRVDEWLLHVIDSPHAGGSRALVRGRVFTRDGRLVASTAQEGLVRKRTRRQDRAGGGG